MISPDKDIVAISTIYRKVNIWKNAQVISMGLTAAQVPIVMLVCQKNGISQNEVVEELALEKSVVSKSIIKLIEAGYLTREQNEKDKRTFNLFATERAQAVYPALVKQGKGCMELLTTGMTAEEKETLSVLLHKMLDNSLKKLSQGQEEE